MNPRLGLLLAILLPFAACGVQWLLWDTYIKPYVWFLFFPSAFFSAWFGGLRGGLAGTLFGALLVWYVFIPPQYSWELENAASAASIVLFIIMGGLFAWFFDHLQQAMRRSDEARVLAEYSKEKITRLYRKTLELDELKSQFFANVSHELRTPLTLIMAPLERRLATANMSSDDRAATEMMLRNARLLYRHVSDLLDTSKLEAGAMHAEYARINLVELTRVMFANFDVIARERRINYRIDVPTELPVEADSEKVQRILLNLLSNAFKFTPDGGRIEVRLYAADEKAVIEVQDNGPGVPSELRLAVFERFRQVEGKTTRHHGGTGLGLAIVREFAHLHGGSAAVGDAPGGGALFSIRLPLKAPAGTPIAATQHQLDTIISNQIVEDLATCPAAASTRAMVGVQDAPLVLVVEDNADMNAFIADILKPHYRVASAFNGLAGLEKAQVLAPDLILADVMMPEMSGDEMVMELRRKPEMANVPIIMLTAKADDELHIKLLHAGVQDYLAKPFNVEELLARVGGLLKERQRMDSELRESENRFEATFEHAAVGIALIAPDGRWLRVNNKFCNIIGFTADELLSKTFEDITFKDDLDTDLKFRRQILAKEIDSYTVETRYIRKDGGVVWINLTVALVSKPDGRPDYFISVIKDISDRKVAETKLKCRNEELERFDSAAVERELAMIRLKQQVNDLARQLGHEAPYDLSFVNETDAKPGEP